MKTGSKKEKIERAMAEMTQFEKEKMLQAWDIVKIFASDVNDKRPWIYWEDVKKVIEKIYKDYDISEDQHAILNVLKYRLEQKVWIPGFEEDNGKEDNAPPKEKVTNYSRALKLVEKECGSKANILCSIFKLEGPDGLYCNDICPFWDDTEYVCTRPFDDREAEDILNEEVDDYD